PRPLARSDFDRFGVLKQGFDTIAFHSPFGVVDCRADHGLDPEHPPAYDLRSAYARLARAPSGVDHALFVAAPEFGEIFRPNVRRPNVSADRPRIHSEGP